MAIPLFSLFCNIFVIIVKLNFLYLTHNFKSFNSCHFSDSIYHTNLHKTLVSPLLIKLRFTCFLNFSYKWTCDQSQFSLFKLAWYSYLLISTIFYYIAIMLTIIVWIVRIYHHNLNKNIDGIYFLVPMPWIPYEILWE